MTMEILPEPTSKKLYGRSDTYVGNHIKEILLNLNLLDHRLVLTESEVHVKMEMEIPRSKVKFITACSYSIDEYNDVMKAQIYVIQNFHYSNTQKDAYTFLSLPRVPLSYQASACSLSTLHFLKIPENSFEVLKLLENSVEVLNILENKLESMKILKNK
ncbi:hypothetical protein Tco_0371155 [Tanacetum coccineum]